METIEVSAPGKVFLLGEYAVLERGSALLSAVDRRVRVRIRSSDAAGWHLSAPAIGIESMLLDEHGGVSADTAPSGALRLFETVREAVRGRAGRHPAALDIVIDSGSFAYDGHKLGLGSSAAVAVALAAALARSAGLTLTDDDVFALAIAAHRAAQGGTGSGGDVATSVYGGLLEYTVDEHPMELEWPHELSVAAVLTGTGASTTRLVGSVADYARREPAGYRDDMAELVQLAAQTRDALNDPDRFLALVERYFAALCALGEHSGAGIVTERHRMLAATAADNGGVFKTSGAGGGDVGLVFSRATAAASLRSAMEHAGAQIVPLTFDAAGLHYGERS